MKKLREFDLLESYNEAYDSLRVNTVSRTEDNKKVHFKPRNQITAYYNVTDTSSATRILGADFDTSQIRYMVVDGVKVYPTYYDETEEQVIEAYNMEEQSYTTMSLNLDDDDMDYRQHIASPNEGYGEIMTTMALNNDVETYDVNTDGDYIWNQIKNDLGFTENEENLNKYSKYESKYTSYINDSYIFNVVGDHVITFFFKDSVNEINHMFNSVKKVSKIDLTKFNGSCLYYNGGLVQTFERCNYLDEIIVDEYWDVSNVFSTVSCFQACHNLKKLPIKNWKFKYLERASWMFNEFNSMPIIDISGWNTKSIKQMVGMFANGMVNEIIIPNNFGESCETFQQMFYFSKIKTISNGFFNTSCAKNLSQMFRNCPNLEYDNLSTFDTTNVFDMSYMFYETGKINNESFLNLNWNTEKLETAYRMFYHCYALSSLDLNSFYTPKLNNCQQMFFGNWSLFDLKIDNLNTDNCNSYYEMFAGTHVTNLNLSSFNSSNVTNMDGMFRQGSCPLDLRNFDLTKVTSMYNTFQNMGGDKLVITSALNQNLNAYGAFDNDSSIIKTFYSNPQHDYSVLTNEMSSNWRYKYIPTEVTFLVKLLNNEDLSLITNKTLFLKQDIIVENQETKEDIITNTNIITSTYDEELDGYPFTFVAYNNQYSIYEEGSETPIGEVMTYNNESTLIYGDINNVSYDIIATYKLSTSGSTTLFNASFSKDNLMVMVVDDVQIPLKSNKYTFEDTNEHIVKIKFKEKPTAYDLQYMFNGCSAMRYCDLSNLDTSEVTSMYGMFQGCTSLSSVTFGSNDTTNVTNKCIYNV